MNLLCVALASAVIALGTGCQTSIVSLSIGSDVSVGHEIQTFLQDFARELLAAFLL